MKKNLLKISKTFLLLFGAGIIFIVFANYNIKQSSDSFMYDDASKIPTAKVAMLLGTSKTLSSGFPNAYFTNRIKAAADLYKSGKIKYIIVSGDNSQTIMNPKICNWL